MHAPPGRGTLHRGGAHRSVVAPHRYARPARRSAPSMVFTGIVQGTAEVMDVDTKERFSQVKIKFPPGKVESVKQGASVAINGTCLTVTEVQKDTLSFDIMMETLRATNLGELGAGSVVNFERAAKLGDEVGGHAVSGHVHTTGTITNVEQLPNNRRVTITVNDDKWMKYIMPKGYIAIDGTSLTVGEVFDRSFTIYLIPETLRVTVFGIKSAGDSVNIEIESTTQAIVDTVEKVVARYLGSMGIQSQQSGNNAQAVVAQAAAAAQAVQQAAQQMAQAQAALQAAQLAQQQLAQQQQQPAVPVAPVVMPQSPPQMQQPPVQAVAQPVSDASVPVMPEAEYSAPPAAVAVSSNGVPPAAMLQGGPPPGPPSGPA